ncbi:hypothetical protein KEM52_001927 [Ascosphaera acerosa]|nr:hypothetical protein KEM52_001927 [Ascosphaera acerosa]
MADAISIEQNNKIRAALGLKPLPVPGQGAGGDGDGDGDRDDPSSDEGSTLEKREAMAGENWRRLQAEQAAKRRREQRSEAVRRAREAAQRAARLTGPTLGEVDADMDTRTWLGLHSKKRKQVEKERARRLAEELEARERERAVQYTAADLRGVRVAHELDELGDEEAGEQILTLKDTTIDEDEEEEGEGGGAAAELENVQLRERERTRERVELKKKRAPYDPNEQGSGSILAQYDEEIEGKKRKRFTLDSAEIVLQPRESGREAAAADRESTTTRLRFSLDDVLEPAPTTSDYQEPAEIKIRKPKKKKAKSTRKRRADDDDSTVPPAAGPARPGPDLMDIDQQPISAPSTLPSKRLDPDIDLASEELEAFLAAQRRAALRKRKKMTPEEIARQLKEEEAEAEAEAGAGVESMHVGGGDTAGGPGDDGADDDDDETGVVLNEMSEFVANLSNAVISRPTAPPPGSGAGAAAESSDDQDSRMGGLPTTQALLREREQQQEEHEEHEDYEEAMALDAAAEADLDQLIHDAAAASSSSAPAGIKTSTGLDEESELSQGVGSALAMLKQRGLVRGDSDASSLTSLHRDRQRFLQEKLRLEAEADARARAQRERDRASGRFERMSGRDREEFARQENKARDVKESRQLAEIFNREYKPDVQLKYVDEFGRLMDQKEAFKHLSHQFHGKGSGKMKTAKHLKKIEEEKKREAMSTLDSSQHTGMNSAMGATARKNRQAGVSQHGAGR